MGHSRGNGPDPDTAEGRSMIHKATVASTKGNMTEWFEYGVHAVTVTYITAHFFPGEYGGATTFMAEHAPDRTRGCFGSFLEFGTLGGFALGAAVMLLFQLVLPDAAMDPWGWMRINR